MMRWCRTAVALGAVAYVAGGWIGWGAPPASGFPVVRAHELAGVAGDWIWLGAAPMLAAAVAPFTRGWLRWLWLTVLPPSLYVVWAWRYGVEGSAPQYPFFPAADGPYWGVGVSVAGAGLALGGLVSALILAVTGGEEPRARWQLPAVLTILTLSVVALVVVRGPRNLTAERMIRADVTHHIGETGTDRGVERVRV